MLVKELDFKGLADHLLGMSRELVAKWLPGGELRGREYVCGDFYGSPGDSCSVNIDTGRWADFAQEQKGGDFISLFAAIQNIKQGDAAKQLAFEYGYDLKKDQAPVRKITPQVQIPPPGVAEAPSMHTSALGAPVQHWCYRDYDGFPLFYVARYNNKDGKKSFLPWCYIGGMWASKSWPAPRPLYGLELLSADPDKPVMIVEGEKAADAACKLCGETYIVVSWPNGSKAYSKADWRPVYGRKNVLMVPDADVSGTDAMEGIARMLLPHVKEIKIIDIKGMPKGWDLADEPKWKWKDFKVWARPRAKLFPYPTEVEVMPDDPQILIDQSKTLNLNVKVGESEPIPTPSVRDLWKQYGLVLTDSLIPVCNLNNCVRILESDKQFESTIWYDEFHKKYFKRDKNGKAKEWSDVDTLELTNYVQSEIGLRRLSDDLVNKAVTIYGHKNLRNEPREWMDSLTWDKHKRVDRFFVDFMGSNDSAYERSCARNFWISMVARIYRPGCKVDNMIILEGAQGKFKSMALNYIGGKFYTEAHESVMSKDFYMILHGKFLIEISELDAFSKAEAGAIKKVITNQTDRFRIPYGRAAQDFPRQCIFVGTTNEELYLRDHTGGRRFWPIKTTNIQPLKILDARDQLFAEAVHRYKAGEDWYIMPEEMTEDMQESRRLHDEWESPIASYVAEKQQVALKDVALDALHIEIAKLDIGVQRRIGRILTRLFFVRKTVRMSGQTFKVWQKVDPPEEQW